MKSVLLNGSDWTLAGYWQHQWRLLKPEELVGSSRAPIPPVRATVPGAIHADLLRAGLIPDWQDGLNAEKSEWVNNREWLLQRSVTVPRDFDGRLTLDCDGLDYSGLVLINGKEIGGFEGTHLRHRFDLIGRVKPGESVTIGFLFHLSPSIEGVYGYTSQTRIFKPRFGYCWDWCPRLVNVGIWQDVRLVSRGPTVLEHCRVLPRVNDDLSSGTVHVLGQVTGPRGMLRYTLRDGRGAVIKTGDQPVGPAELNVKIPVERIQLWWPATHGHQPLYQLTLELLDTAGQVSDRIERTMGFKRVRWLPNSGAPAGAKPYWCEVNGVPIFLRGINWVPLSPFYGTVAPGQYQAILSLYRNMNVNLLRVWGGGILETPAFYEWCDRLGLMVWQELPLSSSGIENWPPEDPAVIDHLQMIGREYLERRAHHPSHLLWCGGNELQGSLDGGKTGIGKPVDESHPLMARWRTLIEELDPGKRFQATSPSGPMFYAHADDYGRQVHHQVHGPWGNLPLSERYHYWNRDDSLFRSENGAPACSALAALERRRGGEPLWPPRDTNRHWLTPGAAWIPWNDVSREFGEIADDPGQLPMVAKASRYLQAESYRYAAEACRRRYPTCTGYVIWMGHDSVHLTANNSVIEIDGSTKPAYDWLRRAYATRHVSLKHDSIVYPPGERIKAEVWVHRDALRQGVTARAPATAGFHSALGSLLVKMRRLDGTVIESLSVPLAGEQDSFLAAAIDWAVPEFAEKLFVVEMVWDDHGTTVSNRYLLSQDSGHPLAPLLAMPPARLSAKRESDGRVTIANSARAAAVGVQAVSKDPGWALLTDAGNLILFAGETQAISVEAVPMELDRSGAPELRIECFNCPGDTPVD